MIYFLYIVTFFKTILHKYLINKVKTLLKTRLHKQATKIVLKLSSFQIFIVKTNELILFFITTELFSSPKS